ncbi:MAG: NAD(P)-dependent oxidoreductase [Treponema sp.]
MKIAVICANGKAGRLITQEAVNREQDVTAIVRSKNESAATKVIQKDLFNLTAEDLKSFDVVIDAFGAWTLETFSQHSTSIKHLCDILNGTKIRLLIVGGAGCLYVNNNGKKTMIIDTPDFPEMFKPLAKAEVDAFLTLQKNTNVLWTYVCPPFDFKADGKRTGLYKLGGDEMLYSAKGESTISYADYAIAMVDEAMNGNHIKECISVVEK